MASSDCVCPSFRFSNSLFCIPSGSSVPLNYKRFLYEHEGVFLQLDGFPHQWCWWQAQTAFCPQLPVWLRIPIWSIQTTCSCPHKATQEKSFQRWQLSSSLTECSSGRKVIENEWVMSDCPHVCGLWQLIYTLSPFQQAARCTWGTLPCGVHLNLAQATKVVLKSVYLCCAFNRHSHKAALQKNKNFKHIN